MLRMSSERLGDSHYTTLPVGSSRALIPIPRLLWLSPSGRAGSPLGSPCHPELPPQLPLSSSSKLGFQSEELEVPQSEGLEGLHDLEVELPRENPVWGREPTTWRFSLASCLPSLCTPRLERTCLLPPLPSLLAS